MVFDRRQLGINARNKEIDSVLLLSISQIFLLSEQVRTMACKTAWQLRNFSSDGNRASRERQITIFDVLDNKQRHQHEDTNTVYELTHNGIIGRHGVKRYEDHLPDDKEIVWRKWTKPRPHCKSERRVYHHGIEGKRE